MARRAHGLWHELESASGRQLLAPVGQLSFGDGLDELAGALREAGAPDEWLTEREAAARFPAVTTEGPCLYEPESCVIAADRVLAALAEAVPGLRAGQPVTRVEPDGDRVTIHTGDGSVTARAAVITAGPWTADLIAAAGIKLPTTPTLEQVAYFVPADGHAVSDPGTNAGGADTGGAGVGGADAVRGRGAGTGGADAGGAGRAAMAGAGGAEPPIFIRFGGWSPYGLPVPGSGRYKVGLHPSGAVGGAGRVGPAIRPGGYDAGEDPALRAAITDAVRRHLPGYRPEPVASERCVYDNTPDEDFVLDRAGPLVIGCGTSGHGFKFGPLLGEWLADLATGRDPAGLPPRFALTRFR
jgi:sarcosine oxidase